MNAKLRLAACLLAVVAVISTGCTSLLGGASTPSVTTPKPGGASVGASSTATPGTSTPATPVVENTFAAEPAPKPADPILTSGDWGYHAGIDWDDAGGGKQINSTAEQNERYKLIKEQYTKLLDALKDSSGVKRLVSAAGGDTSDIKYSVVTIDAMDLVAPHTPWVTATLRATFPSEDGLKAVDVFVYRNKTAKGLNNTPYVSGTSVGYVDTDGSIKNPSHPAFPR
ncbi:MAG: hypothetical protein P4L93_06000 [Coriobacteriia bacterium]|nr:hypothetical protein [Coriobacteriia bacterium]